MELQCKVNVNFMIRFYKLSLIILLVLQATHLLIGTEAIPSRRSLFSMEIPNNSEAMQDDYGVLDPPPVFGRGNPGLIPRSPRRSNPPNNPPPAMSPSPFDETMDFD
ncbi:hypothetical protein Leryth_001862 [Lithospermum erythrorhizon]|nr:hypothetical protein Leryth_001862 [Lithospermum erythrorhizon]